MLHLFGKSTFQQLELTPNPTHHGLFFSQPATVSIFNRPAQPGSSFEACGRRFPALVAFCKPPVARTILNNLLELGYPRNPAMKNLVPPVLERIQAAQRINEREDQDW